MKIKLTLLSDLCTTSGESIAGVIDIDSVYDEYGLPYIPARRFKGVLRDAALELLDFANSPYSMKDIDELFGKTGQFHFNSITLGNGYLKNYEELVDEIKALQQHPHYNRYYRAPFIIDYYSTERSQTTIDRETRTAKPHSLRRTRFVKRGVEFYFDVEVKKHDHIEFLRNICKNVRHIGLGRTRGFGEVSCELIDDNEETNWTKPNIRIKEGQQLKLTYRLKTQIILPSDENQEVSFDFLPGSVILGAFAGLYVRKHGLGSNAHQDPNFKRLFLSHQTRFNAAYIADDNGNSYQPVSFSYYCVKDGNKVYDRAVVDHVREQVKGLSDLYVRIEDGVIYRLEPKKKMEYHHQRPEAETIGHAVEEDGVFFQYDTLLNDQRFVGTIEGSKEDLETILSLIPDDGIIYFGRSKTAQYGQVLIESIETITPDHNDPVIQPGESFSIVLQSPMILMNDQAVIMPDVKLLGDEIKGVLGIHELEITKQFTKFTKVTGFNRKWKLPKIQYPALEKGTTLVLRNKHHKPIQIGQLDGMHFGLKQNEGFGKIRVEIRNLENLTLSEYTEEHKDVNPQFSKDLLYNIQHEMVEREIETIAYKKPLPGKRGLNSSTVYQVLHELDKATSYYDLFEYLLDIKMMSKRQQIAQILTNKRFESYDEKLKDKQLLVELAKDYLGYVIREQLKEAKKIPNERLLDSLTQRDFYWYKVYMRVIFERLGYAFRGEKDE